MCILRVCPSLRNITIWRRGKSLRTANNIQLLFLKIWQKLSYIYILENVLGIYKNTKKSIPPQPFNNSKHFVVYTSNFFFLDIQKPRVCMYVPQILYRLFSGLLPFSHILWISFCVVEYSLLCNSYRELCRYNIIYVIQPLLCCTEIDPDIQLLEAKNFDNLSL